MAIALLRAIIESWRTAMSEPTKLEWLSTLSCLKCREAAE